MSDGIAHELRSIARYFRHLSNTEPEPSCKQSHADDANTCDRAADLIDRLSGENHE